MTAEAISREVVATEKRMEKHMQFHICQAKNYNSAAKIPDMPPLVLMVYRPYA